MTKEKLTDQEKEIRKKAGLFSLSSLIPGLGQVLNKQWYKAVILWLFLLLLIIIEISTSRYGAVGKELANATYGSSAYQVTYSFVTPDNSPDLIYFWRDYGGFITRGFWGLFSLGSVGPSATYRGFKITVEIQQGLPWTRFDDSAYLLGFGLIAFVLVGVLLFFWISTIVDAYKTRKKILSGEPLPSFKEYIKDTYENMFAYIILIPAITLILVFTVIPLLFSGLVAFSDFERGTRLYNWGFSTFNHLIENTSLLKYFLATLWWTIIWAFMSSFTVYTVGFIHALVIESKYVKGIKIKIGKNKTISLFGKKFWRTIFILPWAIPSMITLMMFKNVFNVDGLANEILRNLKMGKNFANFLHFIGLAGDNIFPISWVTKPISGNLARAVVILTNLWLGWPYHMMLITGVLATIPLELYEAADIDGANSVQKFRYITLTQVLISTMPSIIMTFSFNFNNFGAIYFLTGGAPAYPDSEIGAPGQTDILISWIYKLTFNDNTGYYARGAIYSILIFLLVGVFSVWNMSRTKLMQEEE